MFTKILLFFLVGTVAVQAFPGEPADETSLNLDGQRGISNYDIIEIIKQKIIELIQKVVGTSQKVIDCIKKAAPEINALASEAVTQVQECMSNGGNIIQCVLHVMVQSKEKLDVIINNVKTCANSLDERDENSLNISNYDLIQEIEDKIKEIIQKLLGTGEKVVKCIERVVEDIKSLAGKVSKDVQDCLNGGGSMGQCVLDGLVSNIKELDAIITNVKICVAA